MIAFLALSILATNDGGLSYGGTPKLMSSHPGVRMSKEVIRINVHEEIVTADCEFWFSNTGKACEVRMGFPDRGEGANDPDEELAPEDLKAAPPRTTMSSFRSWIDGKRVYTKLERGEGSGQYWHTKFVKFPAGRTVRVRDLYTQSVSGGMISGEDFTKTGYLRQVSYILETGRSWKGTIGSTDVRITFSDKDLVRPFRLVEEGTLVDPKSFNFKRMPRRSEVVWRGPARPTVTGSTIRFVKKNWKPRSAKDDISLGFGFKEARQSR